MSNLKIITGHYGSGKTEFCVNLAIQKAEENVKVALVDLDIVNPYFRSRERRELLNLKGIEVLGSNIDKNNLSADMPALPAEINKYIETKDIFTIFDVGGDGAGARVLSRFSPKILLRDYDMYVVINANRPFTSDINGVISYIKDIETQSRLRINGIINNTHMLRETTLEDILKGYDLCKEVSLLTELPLVFNVIPKYLKILNIHSRIDNVFILNELYMRPDWL